MMVLSVDTNQAYDLEYSNKIFYYSSIQAWDSIPSSIRDLPILQQFKNNLKAHLRSGIRA